MSVATRRLAGWLGRNARVTLTLARRPSVSYGTIASYDDVSPGSVVEVECERRAIDLRVVAHETAHETVEVEVRATRDDKRCDAMFARVGFRFATKEKTNALKITVR